MAGPPTPSDITAQRNSLRARLRQSRDLFAFKREFDCKDSSNLASLLANALLVGSYVAMASEAGPSALIDGMTSVALPYLRNRQDIMTFRRHGKGDGLEQSRLNFVQPSGTSEIVAPDLILTPLLGFDRAGNRLGQGAGHYDRYFAGHPTALRIGLAWSVQEVDALPVQPWDVSLDAICTECEWIVPKQSRLSQ